MSENRDHRIRHILESVYATPWAITTRKLDDICQLIDARRDHPATEEELAAYAAGAGDASSDGRGYSVTAGGVAVLPVSGVILQKANLFMRFSGGTSTEKLAEQFKRALADSSVKSILLDINSPGGQVGGVAEVSDLIHASRGQKPIVALANTAMNSAAYWIGSAADRVVASPSASVGSIGVYMIHAETSARDAANGTHRTVISAGRFKTVGNDAEPLTEEARGKLQEFVDSAYRLFTEAVARNRSASIESIRGGYGEGDSLLSQDALAAGLVDQVARFDQIVGELEGGRRSTSTAGRRVPTVEAASRLVELSPTKEKKTMDPKVIAALFARGLIAEQSEDQAKIALGAWAAARGHSVPENAEDMLAEMFAPMPAKTEAPAPVDQDSLAEKVAAKINAREAADRFRVDNIRATGKLVGLTDADTETILAMGLPVDQSLPKIREKVAGREGPLPKPDLQPGAAEFDKFSSAAQEALDYRCLSSADAKWTPATLSEPAREIKHWRMIDMATQSLKMAGIRTEGMPATQIAKLALASDTPAVMAMSGGSYYTTGSFANLTLNSARKTLVKAYQEAPVSWRQWVRQGESVPDFKLNSLVKFGEVGDLDMVPEGRAFPEDIGLTDDREYFVVETFAKIVSFTRVLLINDDLSALSRLPQLMGNAAARTFNKLVYKILTGNPAMADGVALFHASSHGANLIGTGSTTAAPPSTVTVQLLGAAMRKQAGLNADTILNLTPRYVIVPAALEATTLALCRSVADPAGSHAGVANIYGPTLTPVVEAILDGNSAAKWYVAADSSQVDTISVRFLQGEETPVMEDEYDFETKGRKYSIQQTGAAVLEDYRGMAAHTGFSA